MEVKAIKVYTFEELRKKISTTESNLEKMKKNLREICPHNNIKGHWIQDHESATFLGTNYLTCEDCNLSGNDEQESEAYTLLVSLHRKKILR